MLVTLTAIAYEIKCYVVIRLLQIILQIIIVRTFVKQFDFNQMSDEATYVYS